MFIEQALKRGNVIVCKRKVKSERGREKKKDEVGEARERRERGRVCEGAGK